MSSKKYRNVILQENPRGAIARKCELKRGGTYTVQNREQVEVDGMPKEVATEMLCRPGVRMTNRERKMYWRARTKVFKSTLERVTLADRIALRLQGATWEQLNRWLLRHQTRGSLMQTAYRKASEAAEKIAAEKITEDNKVLLAAKRVVLQKIMAGLNVRGSTHQMIVEALESEIERRQKFIASLRKTSSEVAAKVESKLCPIAQN